MRAAEQRVIDGGISVEELMALAGAAVAEAVWRIGGGAETLILCGPGNNGGDGYVVARLLAERGVDVRVAASGEPKTDAAKAARSQWVGAVGTLDEAEPAAVLVDALFGTGLTRALEPEIEAGFNRLAGAAKRRIAVDLPSGVSTDEGKLLGEVPSFDITVALGALKPAHRLMPAAGRMGDIIVADIGLGEIDSEISEIARPRLRRPGFGDHKYSRGKVTVVAGAMAGAAELSAKAAQRAGAGYVELLGGAEGGTPHALVQRGFSIEALDDRRIGAIVCGPGLGRGKEAWAKLDAVLGSAAAKVLDADALTLIGKGGMRRFGAGQVLTPHWGEFVRLFGDEGRDALSQARAAAERAGAVVLLKGAMSIVASPDGRAAFGAPAPAWLASAGTGDVLAGIVGAMLAAGLEPFEAAQAAVWLHSAAAREAGPYLIADDLIAALPAVMALAS